MTNKLQNQPNRFLAALTLHILKPDDLYLNMPFSHHQPNLTNNTDQNLPLPPAAEFVIYLLRGAISGKRFGVIAQNYKIKFSKTFLPEAITATVNHHFEEKIKLKEGRVDPDQPNRIFLTFDTSKANTSPAPSS